MLSTSTSMPSTLNQMISFMNRPLGNVKITPTLILITAIATVLIGYVTHTIIQKPKPVTALLNNWQSSLDAKASPDKRAVLNALRKATSHHYQWNTNEIIFLFTSESDANAAKEAVQKIAPGQEYEVSYTLINGDGNHYSLKITRSVILKITKSV